jgi:hypothetical protein
MGAEATGMSWLHGKQPIMDKIGVMDWRTVRKFIESGAPIRKINGSWISHAPLLDAWLAEQLHKNE